MNTADGSMVFADASFMREPMVMIPCKIRSYSHEGNFMNMGAIVLFIYLVFYLHLVAAAATVHFKLSLLL
jgi:hypothetical protein